VVRPSRLHDERWAASHRRSAIRSSAPRIFSQDPIWSRCGEFISRPRTMSSARSDPYCFHYLSIITKSFTCVSFFAGCRDSANQ
jgi:hypothetical protein